MLTRALWDRCSLLITTNATWIWDAQDVEKQEEAGAAESGRDDLEAETVRDPHLSRPSSVEAENISLKADVSLEANVFPEAKISLTTNVFFKATSLSKQTSPSKQQETNL